MSTTTAQKVQSALDKLIAEFVKTARLSSNATTAQLFGGMVEALVAAAQEEVAERQKLQNLPALPAQVRSLPTRDQSVEAISALGREIERQQAPFAELVRSSTEGWNTIQKALTAASAELVAARDLQVQRLGLYLVGDGLAALPEGKRDRFLKGGIFGEATGLRLGLGTVAVNPDAFKALAAVILTWDGEPEAEALEAYGKQLAPHFGAVAAALADYQATPDALSRTALADSITALFPLGKVDVKVDSKKAGELLENSPSAVAPAVSKTRTAKLIVDGVECGGPLPLAPDAK